MKRQRLLWLHFKCEMSGKDKKEVEEGREFSVELIKEGFAAFPVVHLLLQRWQDLGD